MAPLLLAAIQGLVSQKEKKDQELEARRQAAARGEAMQHVGSQNKLGEAAQLAGGFLGGNAGGAAGMAGSLLGGQQKTNALTDVDDSLESYDAFKGY